jgi:hypothetical protein
MNIGGGLFIDDVNRAHEPESLALGGTAPASSRSQSVIDGRARAPILRAPPT